jgi:protein TonB
MAVAVIGPNAAHRRIVAKALAGSDARNVREYIDYPAKLTDVPRILEHRYDAILIDVDSDQSYALQIVEKIAAAGTVIVMVYSRRNDPALLRSCLEAGARDFLPLPADNQAVEASGPQTSAPEPEAPQRMMQEEAAPHMPINVQAASRMAAPVAPPVAAPAPAPVPASTFVASVPVPEIQAEPSFAAGLPELTEFSSSAKGAPAEMPAPDGSSTDFNAWDNAWIRATQPPSAKPVEVKPRSGRLLETPAKSKAAAGNTGPQKVSKPVAQEAEEPSAKFSVDLASVGDRNWKKLAFLAAGTGLIVGLLFLVFMRTSRHSAPAAAAAVEQPVKTEAPAQTYAAPPPTPAATKTTPSKPSPMTPIGTIPAATPAAAPVSSEMMDAQLSAPTKIAGAIKRPAPTEEEPSAGFAPGSIEPGGTAMAPVFSSHSNVMVTPGISAISAGVAEGMLLHKTEPIYPEFAKNARVSGTVVLAARITTAGALENLHVISGPEVLRMPALEAVKTWRYRPYKLNNQPVEVDTTIKVIFTLSEH